MSGLILLMSMAIACISGCVHIRKENKPEESKIFCSETTDDKLQLRLTIDIKSTEFQKFDLHKQLHMPYFKKERPLPMRIYRELLTWHNNLIILAEVIPTEITDTFMLYVMAFEKSKDVKLSSSAYILLPLCQDGEMTINGGKKSYSLKAKLELVRKY